MAIAILSIVDEWEEFIKHLENYSKKTNLWDDLEQLANHKTLFINRKAKKFYQENQKAIDEITKYMSIKEFGEEYFYSGLEKRETLDFLHQYFKKHRKEKEDIHALLNKIKDLGFSTFQFNEKESFAGKTYKINKRKEKNGTPLGYMENIKRVLSFGNDEISYQSTGSHYKIEIYYFKESSSPRFVYETIFLNSLTFDKAALPTRISDNLAEDLVNELISQLEQETETKENCERITSFIELNSAIQTLNNVLEPFEQGNLILGSKEQMEEEKWAILQIKLGLAKLRQISTEITPEVLKRERLAYQNRKKKEKI